jgi:hypoxanthine-DNA glycosylase
MAGNIEIHPHQPFVPAKATVLIVGSFPGRLETIQPAGQWFYSARRNQFWTIVSSVYDVPLLTVADKKALCTKMGIGIADIFLKIRRKENNNSDSSLEIIEYNEAAIRRILQHTSFTAVFFTSKFVEKHFKKLLPHITNGECLPSPSPRFATMSVTEKIAVYKSKLPRKPILFKM